MLPPSRTPDDNVLAFALATLAAELQRRSPEPIIGLLHHLFCQCKLAAEGERADGSDVRH
jgi:hypothetical protein